MASMLRRLLLEVLLQRTIQLPQFRRSLVIPIGVDPANDGDRDQHNRDEDHHRCRDPALEGDRARGLRDVGDAVIFKCQQRLGLRSAKTVLAKARVLGAEGVVLALEAGDFNVVGHSLQLTGAGTKRKHNPQGMSRRLSEIRYLNP